jgi:xanthine phosphoribosyltransferase
MTMQDKIGFLQRRFTQTAFVKDAAQGYVVIKEFNLSIDPDVLSMASRCWAEEYRQERNIDAIVGLPDAGARLVSLLGEMLGVKTILPSKRTTVVPGAWEDVVSYSNASFTTGQEEVKSHIGFVKKGMRILVVDDVVAHGHTAIAALKALQAAGAEIVGLAVLFDKVWQGGVETIFQETGVKVCSLVRVKEITADGQVVLEG